MIPRKAWFGVMLAVLLAMAFSALPSGARADGFGAEATVLALHVQRSRDADLGRYTRKVDSDGQVVLTPGAELYYDRDLSSPMLGSESLRFTVGRFRDSVDNDFGYYALMLRWALHQQDGFRVMLNAGPGLILRESWQNQPGYRNTGWLTESEDFLPGYEHRFLPVGEFDVQWDLSQDQQFVWSIVPGLPFVIWHSFGLRWTW